MKKDIITEEERIALVEALFTVSAKILKGVDDFKRKNKLIKIPCQKVPVKEINYIHSTYSYDWDKTEHFVYYDWPWELSSDYEKEIRNSNEFGGVSEKLAHAFKSTDDIVRKYVLPSFIRYIISNSINGAVTIENAKDYADIFVDDLIADKTDKKYTWSVSVWLRNIQLESEEFEIFPNVMLRQPSKEQLTRVEQKIENFNQFSQMGGQAIDAPTILAFSIRAGKSPLVNATFNQKIIEHTELWLNVLRLFRPGDITIHFLEAIPKSIVERRTSQLFEQPQDKFWKGKLSTEDISYYHYTIAKNEEEVLKKFAQKMNPALKEISITNYIRGGAYDLALHRYNDALLKTEVKAYRILNAITALEALLMAGEQEITFKISIRVASLLRLLQLDGKRVSQRIKSAYSLRSKLVHGSTADSSDLLEFARNNTHRIINYTRLCLIILLQLKKVKPKDDLIALLNDAIIDDSKLEELRRLIVEHIEIPILKPFINDPDE